MNALGVKAYDLRLDVLNIVTRGNGGHIGGDMSVMEMLVALYDRMNVHPDRLRDPNRDRFVLSKGHCVEALYAVLADKGFLKLDEVIDSYLQLGSRFIGHPHNSLPGIEMNSGSLGHGLSLCVGMALAAKMDGRSYRVYTVMGDGELAEGSIWEAAMAASHYKLDNLCALVDKNGLQISGETERVMSQGDLADRFRSFGWRVMEAANGNDINQVNAALDEAEQTAGQPSVIIAHTIKGCGSPLMENKAAWHHRVPAREEYARISADFHERKERLRHE